jgi:hypothetical protein
LVTIIGVREYVMPVGPRADGVLIVTMRISVGREPYDPDSRCTVSPAH